MDPDSTSISHRFDLGPLQDKHPATLASSASNTALNLYRGKMNDIGIPRRGASQEGQLPAAVDATFPRVDSLGGDSRSRYQSAGLPIDNAQSAGYTTSGFSEQRPIAGENGLPQLPQLRQLGFSRSDSQGTNTTDDADRVFTPPTSTGRLSPGTGTAHNSSQESQLLQLSQIAAAQERIPEDAADGNGASSRKRMADGMVKQPRDKSSTSPGQLAGHSRKTSTVSVASTAGSRIGELSAELKTRLSYAMVKVNHGWQSHSIDQVETLASQAASPASSTSTIHLRNGSSASPRLSGVSHRGSNNTTPAMPPQHLSSRADAQWRESPHSTSRGSSASPVKTTHGLAPPVSIQPAQSVNHLRRGSIPRHGSAFLSESLQASPHAGPHTPSPYLGTGHHRTMADGIFVSPHTNVREQEAVESLLFMSSPGNQAHLKQHGFPSLSSQPLPSGHNAPQQQRTALPTSQPRKSLPTGRPTHHARSQSHTQKRVGFEKSPMDMDIDEPPLSRGTPRKRINGGGGGYGGGGGGEMQPPVPRLKHMPVSAGLTVSSKPRPALADEDIDRMLDRAAAADDSDSDGEIHIPTAAAAQRARRDGASANANANAVGA